MPSQRFTFPGHSGAELAARLDLPEGPHLATALMAHCFTCGKDIPAARRISARLNALGIAVLRFDFTGLGHSAGEFSNTTFTSNVDDLSAAAETLEARGMAPSLLIGHSLGGAAALIAARRIASLKAVVTIGAPADPGHVTHLFEDHAAEIRAKGAAEVDLAGRKIRIGKDLIDDLEEVSLLDTLGQLGKALLVLHAPRDAIVGIENATQIFVAAKHPKSFATLDDADHLVSQPRDAEYAAEVIAAWASRYLELRPPAPPPGAPEGITRVTEADPDGFLQDIQAGMRFHSIADEPISYGGTNKGMSPYQFLAAGLGACTSMTIRMYARRKGWPLAHVSVDISHDRVHGQDAGQDANGAGGQSLDQFTREIILEGDLSPAQREKLMQIADKCPVHRTLERGARVVTLEKQPETANPQAAMAKAAST